VSARCTRTELIVRLADGRELRVPLSWFDRLAKALPRKLRRVEIILDGRFIELPDAGESISVARLLAPTCPTCLAHEWQEQGGRRGRA
jgi:hypothetical protein